MNSTFPRIRFRFFLTWFFLQCTVHVSWARLMTDANSTSSSSLLNDDSRHDRDVDERNATNLFRTGKPKPTPSPTTSRNPVPTTFAPSGNKCKSSTEGMFGKTTSSPLIITYNYQMFLEASSTRTPNDITPVLEMNMNNKLLSTLFTDCSTQRSRLLRTLSTIQAHIVGMSTKPSDVWLQNQTCPSMNNDTRSNHCFVMEGRLTIFLSSQGQSRHRRQQHRQSQQGSNLTTSNNNNDVMYDLVSDAIRRDMDNGSLNSAHEDIVALKYLNNGKDVVVVESSAHSERMGSSRKSFPAYGYAILVVLVAAFLGGMFGSWKYIRNRNHSSPRMYATKLESTYDASETASDKSIQTLPPIHLFPHETSSDLKFIVEFNEDSHFYPSVKVTNRDSRVVKYF